MENNTTKVSVHFMKDASEAEIKQSEFAHADNEKFQQWRTLRTKAISEMFDNKGPDGIYPTTDFFNKIDEFVLALCK